MRRNTYVSNKNWCKLKIISLHKLKEEDKQSVVLLIYYKEPLEIEKYLYV